MWKIYQKGVYNMQNDERIPNMASKLKSDDIGPPFWPKTVWRWLNRVFWCFRHFFAKKRSNVIRFEFWGHILNPLIILHIIDPILYMFHIFLFDIIFQILKSHVWSIFSPKTTFFRSDSESTPKKTSQRMVGRSICWNNCGHNTPYCVFGGSAGGNDFFIWCYAIPIVFSTAPE